MSTTTQKLNPEAQEIAAGNDLPEGWAVAGIGEICEPPQYGWTTSANKDRHDLKLLRTTDISSGVVNWPSVPGCTEEPDEPKKYLLKSGDLVVSRAGSVGLSLLVKDPPRAVFASYLIRFRPLPPVETEFVALFLKSPQYWSAIAEESAGIAIPNVNASKLREIKLPLPPLAEQKRIVAKIEELLAQVNAARARLARVAQILKRFRQAVLAAACSEGESLPLSEVVLGIKYGTAQKCTHVPTGSPVLRIPNIGDGSVRLDDLKYAKLPSRELAALRLVPGDILMIRSNGSVSLVGKTALVSEREAGFAYAGYLIRLRADCGRVLPEYLNLALQTHSIREQIEIPARSTSGVHNINSTEVLSLKINLPDQDAQKVTVRRVEALFKLADTIEKRFEVATRRAEKLTQAILAKAFRGELVPTEAELARREGRDYEPAAALLARIRSEREDKAVTASARELPRTIKKVLGTL